MSPATDAETPGAALDAHVVVRRSGFALDAAITVDAGETVALMGPSGAGKSTVLAVVSGLLRAREGHVRVAGREMSGTDRQVPPQRRGIVLLGQDPHLFPHLTARDNVAFGLRGRGARASTSRAGIRALAESWLERVGLAGYGDRRPGALSGGQQQRVALARALATGPRVLLLDEPLAALDPATADDIRVMLAGQLPAAATTTLLVTHAVVDAVALAGRLVLLEAGRVTQSGPIREVLTAPATGFGAAIAGVSRVEGEVRGGAWCAGDLVLPAPDLSDGRAAAYLPPGAVRIAHLDAAASARRAVWRARVVRLDATLAGVRLQTAAPAIAVDLPVAEFAARALAVGSEVALAVDPRDVRIVATDRD